MGLVVVVAVLGSAACGGGGDPSAPDAAPVVADAGCHPRLTASVPADGATDVAVEPSFVRVEDGDLITLRADGVEVAAAVTINDDDHSIVHVQPEAFAAGTAYVVTAPCDTVSFTTAP